MVIDLPASTYHYYIAQKANDQKDHPLEQLIQKIFNDSNETYGYRRITLALRNLGYCVNHKRVQRLMQKLGIKCMKFFHKSRRYNSYKGKVGKVASNRVNRRFTTSVPLQKLVTDVTEFKCLKDEKLCAWISCLKEHGIYQSMSRKGNCLDNSSMENFFGLLKQEMYDGQEKVSFNDLKRRIENYIHFYNNDRIKVKLSGLSPVNYRKQATQSRA